MAYSKMMLTRFCCCYWTVLFIISPMAYGATPAQKHEANNNTQRLKRQFDFGSLFIPVESDFDRNSFDRPQRRRPGPGEPLIFSNDRRRQTVNPTITTTPPQSQPNGQQNNNNNNSNNNNNVGSNLVFINNRPMVATIAPFTSPTTASPQFLSCFGNCPTTSEYNPICASNQQQYQNQQKFDCAQRCGADIQIVRRGSCVGLFPMQRG